VKQLGDFTDFTRDSTIKDDKTSTRDRDAKLKDREDNKEGSKSR
jgi:hypothetical protein